MKIYSMFYSVGRHKTLAQFFDTKHRKLPAVRGEASLQSFFLHNQLRNHYHVITQLILTTHYY